MEKYAAQSTNIVFTNRIEFEMPIKEFIFLFFLWFWTPSVNSAEDCSDNFLPSNSASLGRYSTTASHEHADENFSHYLAGMDKTMIQKIGFLLSYLLAEGKIADMGSGSGKASFELAKLFPNLDVVGVDFSNAMIQTSSEKYVLKNLNFTQGDVSKQIFNPNSLSGIFFSSVLHEVISYGTTNFDSSILDQVFKNIQLQLKDNGVVVIRDFLIPNYPEEILLDLPINDGNAQGTIGELSSASLFKLFLKTFKSSLHLKGNIPYSEMNSPHDGFRRFKVNSRIATEFVLRKDYRESWDSELKEQYTYYQQKDFEEKITNEGLRILYSAPIYNSWIIQNRFKDKFYLYDLEGIPLGYPPTNYVIAAQKIPKGMGVKIVENSFKSTNAPRFLKIKTFFNVQEEAHKWELVIRPNDTLDILPYFRKDGRIYIVLRHGYPRPVITSSSSTSLELEKHAGYTIEQLNLISTGISTDFHKEVVDAIKNRLGIDIDQNTKLEQQTPFFTSPGVVSEKVTSFHLELSSAPTIRPINNGISGFSNDGVVTYMEGSQILRSSQVGGLTDTRLEIGIYELFLNYNFDLGPWVGDPLTPVNQQLSSLNFINDYDPTKSERRVFKELYDQKLDFFDIKTGTFQELDESGSILNSVTREYAIPKNLSNATITTLPFMQVNGKIYFGIEDRDLPALQFSTNHSNILTTPAFRIPKNNSKDLESALNFSTKKLQETLGIKVKSITRLGGRYYPSPGVIPEVVYPFLVEVDAQTANQSQLLWFSADQLRKSISKLEDLHLKLSLLRASHMLKQL
jgi:ubiquinone/menaquinone biosynthesis C-methylase UbiE